MLFDGNKNGSETHDDLPLGFVALQALTGNCSGTSKKVLHRVSKRVELRIAIALSRFGARAGMTEFVAPTTKVAEFQARLAAFC
jgi:hypothetical protein